MARENQKFCDIGAGRSLVWDRVDGVDVVYIEEADGSDDIIIETADHIEAEAVYNDYKKSMGV